MDMRSHWPVTRREADRDFPVLGEVTGHFLYRGNEIVNLIGGERFAEEELDVLQGTQGPLGSVAQVSRSLPEGSLERVPYPFPEEGIPYLPGDCILEDTERAL